MSSGIAINPHEAIILAFTNSHHTVEIGSLKEGIKDKIIFSFPMLPAEGTISELHIVGCFDVIVWKAK